MWGLTEEVSRLVMILLIVLLIAVGGYAFVLHWERSSLEEKLTTAQLNYKVCQGNTTALEGAIKNQNDALEAIKTAQASQAAAEATAQAAADDMRRLGRAAQDAVARLKLTGKCPADMQLLGNSIK
jgi:Tfp pilus assembly protein PilO